MTGRDIVTDGQQQFGFVGASMSVDTQANGMPFGSFMRTNDSKLEALREKSSQSGVAGRRQGWHQCAHRGIIGTWSSTKTNSGSCDERSIKSLHCIRAAQTLNRLHRDLGSQGFQAVGIVFGPDADVQRVNYLVEDFKLTFPVGYANLDKVDSYLARESNEILNIPQIVVIDRAGVIRAQSGKKGGSPTLENESSLRSLIDSLLKEEAPKNAKGPGVARKKGN